MITNNEKKILKFLLVNFDKDYSINEVAKKCELSPNGAYEILKKFEEKGVLLPKKISNVKSYKINFSSKEAIKLLELMLIPNYKEDKISYRYNDLKLLEEITSLCIIFGSYITKKENPNDIDVLFVIKKENYKKYSKILEKVKRALPLKIHDIIQTKEDLSKNIKKRESIILKAISEGVILWGHEFLIEVIKNDAEK
ncbi:MAG: winged helix-turn-helix domain-containing protein [Nanoarchaeota archaeon]